MDLITLKLLKGGLGVGTVVTSGAGTYGVSVKTCQDNLQSIAQSKDKVTQDIADKKQQSKDLQEKVIKPLTDTKAEKEKEIENLKDMQNRYDNYGNEETRKLFWELVNLIKEKKFKPGELLSLCKGSSCQRTKKVIPTTFKL